VRGHRQLVDQAPGNGVRVLFGGGLANFRKKADGGKRLDTDDNDLVQRYVEHRSKAKHGHAVLTTKREFDEWKENRTDFVLGKQTAFT
jgi:alkaline phosphatase